jgi:hypothetical protein
LCRLKKWLPFEKNITTIICRLETTIVSP